MFEAKTRDDYPSAISQDFQINDGIRKTRTRQRFDLSGAYKTLENGNPRTIDNKISMRLLTIAIVNWKSKANNTAYPRSIDLLLQKFAVATEICSYCRNLQIHSEHLKMQNSGLDCLIKFSLVRNTTRASRSCPSPDSSTASCAPS